MHFIFDKLPAAALIAGLCIIMIYPYLGAGLLLAVLCLEAEQYVLMAVCIVLSIALHLIMGRKIRPVRGAVPPSAASRRAERRRRKKEREDGDV